MYQFAQKIFFTNQQVGPDGALKVTKRVGSCRSVGDVVDVRGIRGVTDVRGMRGIRGYRKCEEYKGL